MTSMRFVSPERWWRAGLSAVAGALFGWYVASRSASLAAIIVGTVVFAGSAYLAILISRSHLDVGDEGLSDHRALRVVQLSWHQIGEFEVERPSGPWGGFCVIAVCHDGSRVDLLSTRAYSRLPSARHLDELYRICWTLDEAASSQRRDRE